MDPALSCSSNLAALYSDQLEAVDYFIFIMMLATNSDRMSFIAKSALEEYHSSDTAAPREKKAADEGFEVKNGANFIALKEFKTLANTMLTTRSVDTFLWYIVSAILECLKARPELLTSKESITVEEVLGAGGWDALLVNLAERKVNELSYKGLTGIEAYISKFISVSLFESEEEQDMVRLAVEFRNISAHNRSVVNSTFLRRVSKSDRNRYNLGDRVTFELSEVARFSLVFSKAAKRLDDAIAKKFNVQQKRLDDFLEAKEIERLHRVFAVMGDES